MKKVKRIVALIGVVIIVGMYLATLISAVLVSKATMDLFRVSLILSILVPLIIYVFELIYKWINNKTE